MNKIPMTTEGAKKLKEELDHLKTSKRLEITKAIAEARELGDLKENAEYHAAREEQGLCEARINLIESKLANIQVIDIADIKNEGKVVFGATVTIINLETNQETKYKIVGDEESDIKKQLISISAPIARALIGKKLNEEVLVITPAGEVEYKIIKNRQLFVKSRNMILTILIDLNKKWKNIINYGK